MKKLIVLLCTGIVSLALSNDAYAQSNVVKINIFSPIVKTLNMSYEHAFNSSSSFQIGVYYTGASVDETKFSGFGITPEYRFYLSESNEAPNGFYVAPFARYQRFDLTDDSTDSKGSLSAIGGGIIAGRQWIFKEKFSLDLFLGPAFYSGSTEVTSGTDTFDTGAFDGFTVRFGLTFGFAF
jgi:hypothetical protein